MQHATTGNKCRILKPVQSQTLHSQTIFHNESPAETPVIEPIVDEPASEPIVEDEALEETTTPGGDGKGKYRVILYDDDHHGQEEVAEQIHKATQYSMLKCWAIMMEAHAKGRAICYHGTRDKCHGVARVLREIRLQCEVDCDD